MADAKDKKDAKPAASPEAECRQRIEALEKQIADLKQELRILKGKFANRSPDRSNRLKQENHDLKSRLALLQKALFGMAYESYKARGEKEFKEQIETLRMAAVEYFKQAKIDPEIWKNIAS